jgi:hypothetical protein
MRTVLCSCLLGASLLFSFGCRQSPSATGPFAARFEAARGIGDPAKRDDAYAKLAQDAAESTDVEAAKEALRQIGDPKIRDTATAASALNLAKRGKREEAVEIAKTIGDPTIRDTTRAQIARADTGN